MNTRREWKEINPCLAAFDGVWVGMGIADYFPGLWWRDAVVWDGCVDVGLATMLDCTGVRHPDNTEKRG